jgi:hypothetical protein
MTDPDMRELALRRREDDKELLARLFEMAQRVDMLETTMESKLHLAIEEATTKSIKMVFAHLGVDVDLPNDLQRFRDDLRFGGVFRCAVERSFFAVLAAVAGAIGLAFWVVLQDKIGLK